MAPSLPIREGEPPPDDAIVVIRAGVMAVPHIEHAATQCLELRGVLAISVEAVLDTTVAEACATSERLAQYRQVRLSSFGRLRAAGFALLPTFARPHFSLVLPDLAELTVARLDRCFDPPIPKPGSAGVEVGLLCGGAMTTDAEYDIWVDFMSMMDDRRIWTRMRDVRPGFVPIAGQYAVVGCEDAFPAVARIITVDIEQGIQLEVLKGEVAEHRHLLTASS